MTNDQALFQLRCAAAEWLREHPDSPNAPAVKQALLDTKDQVPPPVPKKRNCDCAACRLALW
jgi:hypothetical protein